MDIFRKHLQILEMNPQTSGLLLVSGKQTYPDITESQRRLLYIAENNYSADAVYFQMFEDKRSPLAQIFIYDNTKNKLSEGQKIQIHKQIWTSEIVPIYYIIEKTQLVVVNAKKKIEIIDDKENFEKTIRHKLNFATQLADNYDALAHPYKAYFFDNGSFWDTDTYKQQFITNESPFEILIKELKQLSAELKSAGLDENIAKRLIIQSILVKYLEEKKDELGNNVFTVNENTFEKNWGTQNFVDTIKNRKLIALFDYLSLQYNGKIFEWNANNDRAVLETLSVHQLTFLSAYLNGNYNSAKNQYAIWRYYSFQYLPVELISRIYEDFLPNMPGVVYTPPFLVDFLIDEAMPIDDYRNFKDQTFKVLDPSLGSGIFCVSAYKRLIDWYKINRFNDTGETFDKPVEPKILQSILKNNIYGTDIEPEAVRVAIFSLTLALLENLTPVQIYSDLKFDDLSQENILHENFFSFFNTHKDKPDFDLVIGNPPFNAPNNQKNSVYFKKLQKDFQIETSHKIPDDNLALVFLDKATLLSKKETGLTCLILPSAPLLYGKWSMDYRTHFLKTYFVPQIVDFTHLRETLFVTKDDKTGRKQNRIATVAVFVKNHQPTLNENIWHIIANRTKKEQNRLFFVFDRYDFHVTGYKRALNERYIWKTNLVGGGRLGRIVERFTKQRTIKNWVLENKDWVYGNGFIIGLKNKSKKADYITDNLVLSDKNFTENGINYKNIKKESEENFKDSCNENLFTLPSILIKRSMNSKYLIPIEIVNSKKLPDINQKDKSKICFTHRILGIHFNLNDIDKIKKFERLFSNRLNSLIIFLTSGEALIRKEKAVNKTDIDNLPFPEDESELELSEIEKVWQDDVLDYYIHQAKSPDTNPLNKTPEHLEKQVKEYGDVFCKVMNASYSAKENHAFKQGRTVETNSYVATCFHYTDKVVEYTFRNETEAEFKNYFDQQTGKNQKITRIVKFYSYSEATGDVIWFIKPKQLRYWLKSIGDRDAFDVYADILNRREE